MEIMESSSHFEDINSNLKLFLGIWQNVAYFNFDLVSKTWFAFSLFSWKWHDPSAVMSNKIIFENNCWQSFYSSLIDYVYTCWHHTFVKYRQLLTMANYCVLILFCVPYIFAETSFRIGNYFQNNILTRHHK
jgi:hypothetical protein